MKINKVSDGNKLTVSISGRLDTVTAPELEAVVTGDLSGVSEFIIDMNELEYISSAGLRVLLLAQKTMNKQGTMLIKNVNSDIMEVFDMTGFTSVLNIEE